MVPQTPEESIPCSCAVFYSMEEVWQIAISHEGSRGNIREAEYLRMRMRGYWDYDLGKRWNEHVEMIRKLWRFVESGLKSGKRVSGPACPGWLTL
jgi:hypothetical protein